MTDDISGSEFDTLTPVTPDIIDGIQSPRSSAGRLKSTHKTAKITAQFAALTLSRDECIEFDHRVPSVFCHCKAGKGRGATITAAVILCVRIVSFTLIFLKTHTYIHRHISEEKIVNPYRTDDSMPQKL